MFIIYLSYDEMKNLFILLLFFIQFFSFIVSKINLLFINNDINEDLIYDNKEYDYNLLKNMIAMRKSNYFNIYYFFNHQKNNTNIKNINILNKKKINIITSKNINEWKQHFHAILFYIWNLPSNENLVFMQNIIERIKSKNKKTLFIGLFNEIQYIQMEEILYLSKEEKLCLKIWKSQINYITNNYLEIEEKIIENMDLILTTTEENKKRINEYKKYMQKEVILFHYIYILNKDIQKQINIQHFFNKKYRILFIGNNNMINTFSLCYFIVNIYPHIYHHISINVKLTIIGEISHNLCFQKYFKNNNNDYMEWILDTKNLSQIFEESIVTMSYKVAGKELDAKNLLSLKYGVPIITNKIGGRELYYENTKKNAIQIAETPIEYMNSFLKIANEENWSEASKESILYVQKFFGYQQLLKDVDNFQFKIEEMFQLL